MEDVISIDSVKDKIQKCIDVCDMLRDLVDVEQNEKEIKTCLDLAKSDSWNYVAGDKLRLFNKIVEELYADLQEKFAVIDKERFEDAKDVKEEDDGIYTVEDLVGYESVLPDGDWPEDLVKKTRILVAQAAAKQELEQQNRRNYVKVKRVPEKKKFDAADAAHALGMDDLAKDLTVNHPKPFTTTVKENGVTKKVHWKKNDVKTSEAFNLASNLYNNLDTISDQELYEKLSEVLKFENQIKEKFPEAVSPSFDTFKKVADRLEGKTQDVLEARVGMCMSNFFDAQRELEEAERLLAEAKQELRDYLDNTSK